MNLGQIIKRNNIVSYVLAALIVFLIVGGIIHIRRPNS